MAQAIAGLGADARIVAFLPELLAAPCVGYEMTSRGETRWTGPPAKSPIWLQEVIQRFLSAGAQQPDAASDETPLALVPDSVEEPVRLNGEDLAGDDQDDEDDEKDEGEA